MRTPDLRLTALSDIHITHFDEPLYEGYKSLERALRFHTEKLPASDAFLFTGDTVYQVESSKKGICEQLYTVIYDRAKSLFQRYIPDMPRYMIMGNHEYPQGNMGEEITKKAQDLFREAYGQETRFHTTVKGFHVIGMSMPAWHASQSDEREAYIMNEVEAAIAEDKRKPVFLMVHNPVPDTTTFSGQYCKGQYSDAFQAWLRTKPQLIVLAGHCHNVNEDDSCIFQDGFTAVNVPIVAVGYMRFDGNGAPNFKNDNGNVFGKSQSVLIEVTDNVVTVTSYDLIEERVVNVWTVDVGGMVDGTAEPLYTKAARDAWGAPEFAPDATVTVETVDEKRVLRVKQSFLPYPHCIKYYVFTFTNKETGAEHTVTYTTDYFKPTRAEFIDKPIPTLPSGEYEVSLRVANSFVDQSLRPLTVHLAVSDAKGI